jgi:hypothetical protein
LPGSTDIEVILRDNTEQLIHLIEHLSVLTRNGDHGSEVSRLVQCPDYWGNFDGFGSRSVYAQNSVHQVTRPPSVVHQPF